MQEIRLLTSACAAEFRDIRLEALARHPTAFAASLEEEASLAIEAFARRLAEGTVFGGYLDGALLGMAGFARPDQAKKRHKGILWGVYVREEARGRGLGRALVGQVIEHASSHVVQLHTRVVTDNRAALRLYESLGFRCYGVEPRALAVDGRCFDQAMMVHELDAAAP